MQRISSVLAICLTALACGCGAGSGSGASTSPERAVRTAVQDWLASLRTPTRPGDNARACGYLTRGLQHSITQQVRTGGEHGTCKTWAAKWTGQANPPGRDGARVTAVNVSGTTATVTLKAPPDRESDVQLKRVAGRWLIDNY
jgi:hypothetical protein